MNIIFMGTPSFACPTLRKLLSSPEHQVLAVYTAPPKKLGRGMTMQKSPVHLLAQEHYIPIRTPTTLKDQKIIDEIIALNADVIIVVAYGFILPASIFTASKYGAINVHPSKLPRFRGSAPVQRTILAGDLDSEVNIILIDQGCDTGDIIHSQSFKIDQEITSPKLLELTANIGAELILETLSDLPRFLQNRKKQSDVGIVMAPKITKEEGLINWHECNASRIDRMVRALLPWPNAYFYHKGEQFKITKGGIVANSHNLLPGEIAPLTKSLIVGTIDGAYEILRIVRQGKKEMSGEELLRGYKFEGHLD